MEKKEKIHVYGFKNIGNSCFMNSSLQCITHCKKLNSEIEKCYEKYGNKKDLLVNAYMELLKNLNKGHKNKIQKKLKKSLVK